jgi:hypothetical protein
MPAKLTLVGRSDHAAASRSSLSTLHYHQVSIRQRRFAAPLRYATARASIYPVLHRSSGSPSFLWAGPVRPRHAARSSGTHRRVWTGDRFRLGATVAPKLGPDAPKAKSGRSSLRANHTASFLPVSGFGSGATASKSFAMKTSTRWPRRTSSRSSPHRSRLHGARSLDRHRLRLRLLHRLQLRLAKTIRSASGSG